MNTAHPLQHKTIGLAQAEGRPSGLRRQLETLGTTAINIATMRIHNLSCTAPTINGPQPIWMIVTSVHAIPGADAIIRQYATRLHAIAIGPTTAAALAAYQPLTLTTAPAPYGSQALLRLPCWSQPPTPKPLWLLTGEDCAQYLQQQLQQQGHTPHVMHSYRRQPLQPSLATLLDHEPHLDAIVCSSYDNLQYLLTSLKQQQATALLQTPLCVINQRMQTLAQQHHWQTVITADNATPSATISALSHYFQAHP